MSAIRHPARHYVHYLISRRIYNAKQVVEQLQQMTLPVPYYAGDFESFVQEVLHVRRDMRHPFPFNPQARRPSDETLAWLKEWRIHDIWRGSSLVATATELLVEPQIRYLLELLLLGPLTAGAIAERIAKRFTLPSSVMNSGVVRAYSHYFWDPNGLSPTEWQRFLSAYYNSYREEYCQALRAPRSPAGAAFVIALADRDPQLLDAAERYEAASSMAFGMMMHHALADRNSTSHTYAAFAALNMMRMADDELSKHRGGSSELLAELRQLKTVYDKEHPLSITNATFIQRPLLSPPAKEVRDVPSDE